MTGTITINPARVQTVLSNTNGTYPASAFGQTIALQAQVTDIDHNVALSSGYVEIKAFCRLKDEDTATGPCSPAVVLDVTPTNWNGDTSVLTPTLALNTSGIATVSMSTLPVGGPGFIKAIYHPAAANAPNYAMQPYDSGTIDDNKSDQATLTSPNVYTGAWDFLNQQVTQASSSVTVNCPATAQAYTGSPITPCTASYTTSDGASGSLTVSYTNNTNVGTATATATWAGDANHSGSSSSASFTISGGTQTITFSDPGPKTYGDADFALSATASSGLAVTFSANGACTVSGSTAHITGAGSCTITASQAGDSNYSAVSTSVLLNIGKATPVITWNNPADITYGTALGGTQLNATASTAGSFTYTPSTGTVLNVGNGQTLHVDFTPTDNTNYNVASKDVVINVLKATPTITWSNPADITYGTVLSGTQLNATASVAGSFVYTPAAGTVLSEGNGQTLHVDFTPTDTANYNTASKDVVINVGKATPTITWNNPADITTGTALSGTQLNATASVAGSFVYTPAAGTVLSEGNGQTLHVDFTPTAPANYNTASKDVMINVVAPATSSGSGGTSPDRDATSPGSGTASPGSGTTPTPPADSSQTMPTITWNITPAPIVYGTELGGVQLNATALVPGVFVYTPPVLQAGNHQLLHMEFIPADSAHYSRVSRDVFIDVSKATPVINWANPSAIQFGTPLGAAQLNATASVPGAFVYTPAAGAVLSPGSHVLHVEFTPADSANYTSARLDVVIQIVEKPKATPAITWNNPADIVYGVALGAEQLNATASVPGGFVFTPGFGTLLNAGDNQILHVDFIPADTASYNSASMDVLINVQKATPQIAWSNPADINYGVPLSATQLNAAASVAGSFVYTPAAGTILDTGNKVLHVDFTPVDSQNYNKTSKDVSIRVLPRNPFDNLFEFYNCTNGKSSGTTPGCR